MGKLICVILTVFGTVGMASAAPKTVIPMEEKGAKTFYIDVILPGVGKTPFMVDTGSGYMTLNANDLRRLKQQGHATYVKELEGILADGQRRILPVYRIAEVSLGSQCVLKNIEAAIMPAGTRNILGLSALSQVAPFTFDLQPPRLLLSRCRGFES